MDEKETLEDLVMSYFNSDTGQSFTLSTTITNPHITSYLNAMVNMLKVIGFSDSVIEKYIGSTYFTPLPGPCSEGSEVS